MVNDYNSLSGLQKVAVLFSVVGEGLALSLVKGLSKTEIRKIRSTLQTMGVISFNVKKRVMEEFYFGFLSEDVGQNGTDGNAIHPFDFLKDLTDEQLFALVNKEEPPVIAMTLAQLEPAKRMEVVNKFDATYDWPGHHLSKDVAQGKKNANDYHKHIKKTLRLYGTHNILINFVSNHDENSWKGYAVLKIININKKLIQPTF